MHITLRRLHDRGSAESAVRFTSDSDGNRSAPSSPPDEQERRERDGFLPAFPLDGGGEVRVEDVQESVEVTMRSSYVRHPSDHCSAAVGGLSAYSDFRRNSIRRRFGRRIYLSGADEFLAYVAM